MAMLQEVGQAVIKLVYDEKDLVKQGNKLSLTMGAKLKTAALAGGAAIATGIGHAADAMSDLASKSTEAYGEFEQLRGGMEKIFDEIDQEQILRDANNAWQDLNLSASEYMSNITGVGATFAESMGDKKGYETARTGMKAIADWASGTGASIDELMGKYQLITRASTQYTTIVDQFSGILPQSTEEFMKQAKAAGFLNEKYKSMTEIPVAEYQEALTKMIEKGVDKANLLGNTAAETANTLTGSMAGARSAIQNLVTGLADPTANIEELTATAFKAVGDYAKNFSKIFTQALKSAMKALKDILPKAIKMLAEMLGEIVPDLIEAAIDAFDEILKEAPTIIDTLLKLAGEVINRIVAKIPEIMGAITTAIVGTIEVLTRPENLLLIVKAGITLLMALVEAIPAIIEALAEALPTIIENIVDWLTSPEAFEQIFIATMTLLGAIIAAIPRILGALFNAFAKLFSDLWEKLKSIFTTFAANFGKAIGNAIAGAINGVLGFIEAALNGPIKAVNGVLDVLNAIPGVNISKLATINLPRVALAEGGIVTSPTRALIGEQGKEAVIPLEQNTGNWAGLLAQKLTEQFELQGGAPGSTINVYFNNQINNELDIEEVNRELLTAIRRAA